MTKDITTNPVREQWQLTRQEIVAFGEFLEENTFLTWFDKNFPRGIMFCDEWNLMSQLFFLLDPVPRDYFHFLTYYNIIPKVQMTNVNFHRMDLTGLDAGHTEFDGSNLSNVNLSNSNLNHVSFARCDLSNAIFFNSVLVGVDFCEAECEKINFNRAEFSSCFFNMAFIEKCSFLDANFT